MIELFILDNSEAQIRQKKVEKAAGNYVVLAKLVKVVESLPNEVLFISYLFR